MSRMPDIGVDIFACLQCGYCRNVCPVYSELGWESNTPRGKLFMMRRWAESAGHKEADAAPGGPGQKFFESLYRSCTTCGACQEVCQEGIRLPAIWEQLREWLVGEGFEPLAAHRAMATGIGQQRNPFGSPAEKRLEWAAGEKFPARAPLVYFVGCNTSYNQIMLAQAAVRLLRKAGLDFSVMGPDEWCCGDPLVLTGQTRGFRELADHNFAAMEAMGASRMVTGCPGCYRTFKHTYHSRAKKPPFEVIHISELLAELLDQGKLRPSISVGGKFIYHDPCELARLGGVYDAPRKVLESIPGVGKVLEFDNNRNLAACCGGGGMFKAIDDGLAVRIGARRVMEASAAGADHIVSCCPACRSNLHQACADQKKWHRENRPNARFRMEMSDIVELVSRSIG